MYLNELTYIAVRPHSTSVPAQDGKKQAEAEGNTADCRDAEQRLQFVGTVRHNTPHGEIE